MGDLICRQAAIDAMDDIANFVCVKDKDYILQEEAIDNLKQLPSAQPERKKGKWILDEDPHDGDCRCSVCRIAIEQMHERHHGMLNALTGGKWWRLYKFCPNCGAKMEES